MGIAKKKINKLIMVSCIIAIAILLFIKLTLWSDLFPLEDRTKPLIMNIVDITKRNNKASHELNFKTKGTYRILVEFKEPINKGNDYNTHSRNKDFQGTSLRLSMDCYNSGKKIYSKVMGENADFEIYYGGWGYLLGWFDVPVDIPKDIPLTCEFEVIEPEIYLVNKYGLRNIHLMPWAEK